MEYAEFIKGVTLFHRFNNNRLMNGNWCHGCLCTFSFLFPIVCVLVYYSVYALHVPAVPTQTLDFKNDQKSKNVQECSYVPAVPDKQ